ncbi:hypothetical protein F889_02089 [Acinetobacter colistiniresistens]|uniref:Amino acid transport protein n=2 Tax=Acinetobacter colistiniresistens TaxID=280145 RepID=N9R6R8_9GAMM|nr:hypothetical protein F889_02089 [Acinetobacter colistiniresistens]EPG38591.1 hypothetical protein F907_01176 [Acinetobacter colistiniresistens]
MRDKNNRWQTTMNATQLFLGVIFSSIGLGYFMYGKKQKMTVPLVCGLVLMLFTYFIDSNTVVGIIGVIVSIIPYFLRF